MWAFTSLCFVAVCVYVTCVSPAVGVVLLLLCVGLYRPMIRAVLSSYREHRTRAKLLALVEQNLVERNLK